MSTIYFIFYQMCRMSWYWSIDESCTIRSFPGCIQYPNHYFCRCTRILTRYVENVTNNYSSSADCCVFLSIYQLISLLLHEGEWLSTLIKTKYPEEIETGAKWAITKHNKTCQVDSHKDNQVIQRETKSDQININYYQTVCPKVLWQSIFKCAAKQISNKDQVQSHLKFHRRKCGKNKY